MKYVSPRKFLIAAAMVAGMLPVLPVLSAASKGFIELQDPVSQTAYANEVPFEWNWAGGDRVTSLSNIYFQASNDGETWTLIDSGIPIRNGAFNWDTTSWPEGVYTVRTVVHRSLVMSVVSPIVIDRSSPYARITSPAEGGATVEDTVTVTTTVVVGAVTLSADAFDYGTGVDSVIWRLDGQEIATGTDSYYRFELPGRHELTVTATDFAGNENTDKIRLLVVPGPGEFPEGPEAPESPEAPEDPTEDPTSGLLEGTELPDSDDVEVPEAPEGPDVDPDQDVDPGVDPDQDPGVDPGVDPDQEPDLDPDVAPDESTDEDLVDNAPEQPSVGQNPEDL